MATRTRTLNLRITKGQYEAIEELVESGEYTSKSEFIRELIRQSIDDFADYIREKAIRDRDKHISLEEYIESRGLE